MLAVSISNIHAWTRKAFPTSSWFDIQKKYTMCTFISLMLSRKTLPSSYQSKIVFCLPPAIKQILRLSIETALRRILRSSAYSSATPKCQISQVPLARSSNSREPRYPRIPIFFRSAERGLFQV